MNINTIAKAVSTALVLGGLSLPSLAKSDTPLEKKPIDLVITLGLQVNYQSCTPRELMEYRVDRAFQVASSLPNPVYLATGKGNPTSVRTCVDKGELTEAAAIKQILMDKYQVDESQIILEENSTNTYANAREALAIVEQLEEQGKKIRSKHLVSSHYHIYRGNINGGNSSAIRDFNTFFGEDTFNDNNSYTSSAFGADQYWGDAFLADEWTPQNSQVYLADVNGNGKSDIIAFKDSEVYVARVKNAHFHKKELWASNYLPTGDNQWTPAMTRLVGDVTGNGKAELIAVTNDGVYVSESQGVAFKEMAKWSDEFATDHGWDASKHLFSIVDVNGNGLADLAAFGDDGLYVAYSNGDHFAPIEKVTSQFGLHSVIEDGSNDVFAQQLNLTNRFLADVNGDGRADVVVYGRRGIYASLQQEDGTFAEQTSWLDNHHGEGDKLDFTNWPNDIHFKAAIDMTGNGRADLANIGARDLFVAHSNGERFEFLGGVTHYTIRDRIAEVAEQYNNFVRNKGWSSQTHFRLLGDVTGNGLPDLVGFNNEGIVVSPNEHQ